MTKDLKPQNTLILNIKNFVLIIQSVNKKPGIASDYRAFYMAEQFTDSCVHSAISILL